MKPQNRKQQAVPKKKKKKTPRGLAIHRSINLGAVRADAHAHSHVLSRHANMFHDKMSENKKATCTHRELCIALEGQASKCRYRITRSDASVFPLWM